MQSRENTIPGLLDWVEILPGGAVLAASFLLALGVGLIDALTAFEISFSFFYLAPVSLASWRNGEKWGLGISAFCAAISLWASLLTRPSYSTDFVIVWNVVVRFAILLLVTVLLSNLHSHLEMESKLARTDYLTGALNSRAFYEVAKMELERARRYKRPLSVAYIDLDDFKNINDQYGHSIGDAVLRTVAKTVGANTRNVDVLARLGGDEFALLLPETGIEAEGMLRRLHGALTRELEKGSWNTTASMGATTFLSQPRHVDEMIHITDEMMYRVKKDRKNAMAFRIYQEKAEA